MGREMKRVPMDFNYPLNKIWYGYFLTPNFCMSDDNKNYCEECKAFASIKGIALSSYGCPELHDNFSIKPSLDPPTGEGYQLWETTSEGSPQSPVFASLDELCEWCAENATTFADNKTTADKWKSMFDANFVHHQEGNITFI